MKAYRVALIASAVLGFGLWSVMGTKAGAAPTLGPGWVAVPLQNQQYLHYTRQEPDGSQSEVTASKNVCKCQVAATIQDFKNDLKGPGVSFTTDKITACGEPGERLIATGIADKSNTKSNVEVWDFRSGPAIYFFIYFFRSSTAPTGSEALLGALCPTN